MPININWREVAILVASGAIGGLLAWLISLDASGGAGTHWVISVSTALLGGAIAAGVGVYLLANTDTARFAHALFFAAVCGITWKPVLETGKDLVNKATTHKEVASANRDIDQQLAAAGQSPNNLNMSGLLASTERVAEKLSSVTSPELESNARRAAIKAISFIATKTPEAAPDALEAIGKRAEASGSSGLKFAAMESLQGLVQNPATSVDVRSRAEKALARLR